MRHRANRADQLGAFMLTISARSFDVLAQGQIDRVAAPIATWLEDELPGWTAPPGSPNYDELVAMCRAADAVGMEAETDYALFALLLIQSRRDWRALLDQPDVRAAFHAPVNAPSKLRWLDVYLNGPDV